MASVAAVGAGGAPTPSVNSSTISGSCSLARSAGPAGTCTTRKPGSTSTVVGEVVAPAADVDVGVARRPGPATTPARARRRSCRRCRPRPAGRAATCAARGRRRRAHGERLTPGSAGRRFASGLRRVSGGPLGAERLVDLDERLLLLLVEVGIAPDLGDEVAGGRRGPRGCRPGRRASPSEISRARAICWRISADGLRRPRSIWLRYGLEMPAISDSLRSESWPTRRCSRMNSPRSSQGVLVGPIRGGGGHAQRRRLSTDASPVR